MGRYSDEIKWNVEEAINHLQAARELLERDQSDAAASRACESAFHMAGALLLDEDIEPGQHGDIVTQIQEKFVQGRLLTKEQGSDLGWLFALRNVEDRAVSRALISEDAHRAVEIAGSFYEAAKVILEG